MKLKSFSYLALATLLFLLSGCGSAMMTRVATIDNPDNGMALVTVLRPSVFGGAIKFSLWDGEQFVGVLTPKSYIQFQAPAGHHIIMARAENWSGVDADLVPGRHYYIIARVMPGAWKARVALDPVGRDQYDEAKIDRWLRGLTPIGVRADKAEQYAAPRVEQVRRAADNFENGRGRTMTLNPDDGV